MVHAHRQQISPTFSAHRQQKREHSNTPKAIRLALRDDQVWLIHLSGEAPVPARQHLPSLLYQHKRGDLHLLLHTPGPATTIMSDAEAHSPIFLLDLSMHQFHPLSSQDEDLSPQQMPFSVSRPTSVADTAGPAYLHHHLSLHPKINQTPLHTLLQHDNHPSAYACHLPPLPDEDHYQHPRV